MMKKPVLVLAVALIQCGGTAAPVPSPSATAASARGTPGPETGPGPAVGAPLPPFEAPDQDGKPQGFESLRGKNGLLLNFNRSVVW